MGICWKTLGYRTALETLYFSGAHRALAPLARGCGLIYMLHRVVPERDDAFQPNAFLEVTPEFLDQVIRDTKAAGIEFVALDEAHRRLADGDHGSRFAVMTLDDGYRDNLEHAWPVFRRHAVPFTIFAASGIADGTCELWWIALEKLIARGDSLTVAAEGVERTLPTATLPERQAAYRWMCHWLGRELDETAQRRAIRKIAADAGYDLDGLCRALAMDWDELRLIAADPLATIGSHTLGHHAVARLDAPAVREQIEGDMLRHEVELGRRPAHFAYPYGGPDAAGPRDFAIAADLGFDTAVTTRPGQLFAEHRDHLTALPRVSLNGLYQKQRYAELFREGVPFALYNRFRRLNVA